MSDSLISFLFDCLKDTEAEYLSIDPCCDEASEIMFDDVYERHWGLRAAIELFPAESFVGLRIKAHAALLAFKHDPDTECNASGSYRSLSVQVLRQLLSGSSCGNPAQNMGANMGSDFDA